MEKNPLRALDCKVASCRDALENAPAILDNLCDECAGHFTIVKKMLTKQGVDFIVDKTLVRGLDYYSRTAFEILTNALGAQSAVAGGGRYDSLVKELGGPDIPAIGFAIGFDRLAGIMAQMQKNQEKSGPDVFIIALGEKAMEEGYLWMSDLNFAGIKSDMDFSGRSLKSLMKRADKLNAGHVLIAGDREIKENALIFRDMNTREQKIFSFDNIVKEIKELLKKE